MVNRFLNLLEIVPYPVRAPLIAVSNEPTALHKPLCAFPAAAVERCQGGFEIAVVLHTWIGEQCGKNCRILKAKSGAGAMVWRSCVRCVAGDGDAGLREKRDRIDA
jgi:hypothetical protein